MATKEEKVPVQVTAPKTEADTQAAKNDVVEIDLVALFYRFLE